MTVAYRADSRKSGDTGAGGSTGAHDRFSRRTRELLTTGDAVLADGRHLLALLRADLRDRPTIEMPVIADEEAVAELRSRRAR